jgi:hypothetical protein
MITDITLPTPATVIPNFAELPNAIQAAIEALSRPFPMHEVRVRPGSVRRDGSAALCLAYADWWTGYLPRLNDEIGPNNWQIDLQPWGEHQIIARLRAFGGLIEKASSGSAKGEANGAQEAEAQAKKRVCAEGVMLGLFFYFLPRVWGKGERIGKDFYFADGEEQRCVYEMYARAGLLPRQHAGASVKQPRLPTRTSSAEHDPISGMRKPSGARTTPSPSSARRAQPSMHSESALRDVQPPARPPAVPAAAADTDRRPDPKRVATARAALAQAERHTGLARTQNTHEPLATDAQLGKIVVLVQQSPARNAAIDRLGTVFGFPALSALDSKAALKQANPDLARRQASELIDALQRLAPKI